MTTPKNSTLLLSMLALGFAFAATSCTQEEPPALPALSIDKIVRAPAAGKPLQAAPARTQSIPADALKLVPKDAVALIYLANPAPFQSQLKEIVDSAQPGAAAVIEIDAALKATGMRAKDLDLTRPMVFAARMSDKGMVSTYILPAKDPKDAADVVELEALAHGKYVSIVDSGKAELGGGSALAKNLPAGDAVVRVDVQRLMARYGKLLDQQLQALLPMVQMMAPTGVAETANSAGTHALNWLKTVQSMDLVLSAKDGAIDLATTFGVPDDYAGRANTSVDLLQKLALPGSLMLLYSSADLTPLVRGYNKLMQSAAAANPQVRAPVSIFASMEKLYSALGDEFAVAVAMPSEGMQAVGVSRPQNGEALSEAAKGYFESIARETESIRKNGVRELPAQNIDGFAFSGWQIRKEVLGGAGVTGAQDVNFTIGLKGDTALMSVGDVGPQLPHVVSAMSGETLYQNPLLEQLQLRSAPRVLYAMDLANAARSGARSQGIPIEGQEPGLFYVAFAAEGKKRELQLHVDARVILDAIKSIQIASRR